MSSHVDRDIELVLFVVGEDFSGVAAEALSEALGQVQKTFTLSEPIRLPLRRSPDLPVLPRVSVTAFVPEEARAVVRADRLEAGSLAYKALEPSRRARSRRHDPFELSIDIRSQLDPPEESVLLLVTDVEIAGSTDVRFAFWQVVPGGAVVSTAPLDPHYWGMSRSVDDRAAVVRQRVRAATMSLAAQFVGLSRCSNPRCCLFLDIDGVSRLDQLGGIGPEHHVAALTASSAYSDATAPPTAELQP